jgi:hypothetical protein
MIKNLNVWMKGKEYGDAYGIQSILGQTCCSFEEIDSSEDHGAFPRVSSNKISCIPQLILPTNQWSNNVRPLYPLSALEEIRYCLPQVSS